MSLVSRSPFERAGALVTQADITVPAERASWVERTLAHYGAVDILVNNAGSGLYGSTADAPMPDTQALFALNVFAPLALIQLVLPVMRAQNLGAIVNVSSLAGKVPLPWMTLYSASKAALSSISCGLRRELAESAIQVTDVLPGYVTTDFQRHASGYPPAQVERARRYAITPEACAEALVRGVERGARTVVAPAAGWLAVWAEQLLPGVVDSPLIRMNR